MRKGFDPDRLDFLKTELARTEFDIAQAEAQRYS
jgi:hypothetical protein